ncbi:MAG: N-acetylneuraminate synthase family protein [Candidatus Kaiserbacteria bacterium]|nr:N-acetylneuraminate synthase family protein [Candidatus Kaiserbacteria bacterium]
MAFQQEIKIGSRRIGAGRPAYVIAEIGSNFDGSLDRAKELAKLCKEAGADAYKIQNFRALDIVSAEGFKNLQVAFQAKWDTPVVDVYKKAEFPREWVKEVSEYCKEIGIDFFSAAYDYEAVDLLEKIGVKAHKLGAGEIDNTEFIQYVAKTGKPILISVGAATMKEIENAVATVRKAGNDKLILLQCVTNYPSPIADSNITAMTMLRKKFKVVVGYSDHTIGKEGGSDDPLGGLTVPLGAVALGASVIEKHVTDDRSRKGPDHPFALTMGELKQMIQGIRAMEAALGDGKKRVMPSEKQTVIIQRRGMYATRDMKKGDKITRDGIVYLRPAVGLRPPMIKKVVGSKAKRDIKAMQPIYKEDVAF